MKKRSGKNGQKTTTVNAYASSSRTQVTAAKKANGRKADGQTADASIRKRGRLQWLIAALVSVSAAALAIYSGKLTAVLVPDQADAPKQHPAGEHCRSLFKQD